MDIKPVRDEQLLKEFQVILSPEDIEKEVDKRLAEIAPDVKVTGFRPGKVPMQMVRQRYGDAAYREVLEKIIPEKTTEIIEAHKLKPALAPTYTVKAVERGAPLQFSFVVELLPDINQIDYKDVSVETYKVHVDDALLKEGLKNLTEAFKDHVPVKGRDLVADGDVVVIDFVGYLDDKPFQGGTANDYQLKIGSKSFIEGFEEGLKGKKIGETVSLDLTFPKEYGAADLAGKKVRFDVKINSIQEEVPAELNDAFVERMGFQSLPDLEDALRKKMQDEYKSMVRMHTKHKLLDALDDRHKFDVPTGMVNMEFEQICNQLERELSEEDKKNLDKVKAEWEKEYGPIAERRVRLGLLLAKIGNDNNITVTNKELSQEVMQQASRFPGQEKQVVEYFRNTPEAIQSLRAPLLEEKVVDFILSQIKIEEKAVSPDELVKLLNEETEGAAEAKKSTKKKPKK